MSFLSFLGEVAGLACQKTFPFRWMRSERGKRNVRDARTCEAPAGSFSQQKPNTPRPPRQILQPIDSTLAGRRVCNISLAAAALRHHFFRFFPLHKSIARRTIRKTRCCMKPQPAREPLRERQTQTACEAVSPLDEPCNEAAIFFCDNCERWFCVAHAVDEEWHPCGIEPGEEGGEG